MTNKYTYRGREVFPVRGRMGELISAEHHLMFLSRYDDLVNVGKYEEAKSLDRDGQPGLNWVLLEHLWNSETDEGKKAEIVGFFEERLGKGIVKWGEKAIKTREEK